MLEADATSDWWKAMPDDVKDSLEESLRQADAGAVMTHEQVKIS